MENKYNQCVDYQQVFFIFYFSYKKRKEKELR